MADLSDLDDQRETFQHLALYEAALLELSHGTVQVRVLRYFVATVNIYSHFMNEWTAFVLKNQRALK